MVRNEEGRLTRAVSSVMPFADTFLVVDTGSTDGTLQEARDLESQWGGVVLQRSWRGFGESRTEMVREAQRLDIADWFLTIDADHVVQEMDGIARTLASGSRTGVDAFYLRFTSEPIVWTPRILSARRPWHYVGATKEFLTCSEPFRMEKVEAPRIQDLADGSSRAVKFERDVDLLRLELAANPDNARSWFSLGESYRGLRQFEAAAAAFVNCALKSNWDEERYVALAQSGEMYLAAGQAEKGVEHLLMADSSRPQRREALLVACHALNSMGRSREVVDLLSARPIDCRPPPGDLFAIVPGAYGKTMRHELETARRAIREGSV
jgi:tetratricopeptide (TPR) repeat protein